MPVALLRTACCPSGEGCALGDAAISGDAAVKL
jgi:hypothetical protein